MTHKILYVAFESAFNIDFASLCKGKRLHQEVFNSNRKLISRLKKQEPDFVIAEFIYSPSLGTQISNLDGLLGSVERYCHQTRLIIFTESRYRQQLESVAEKFTLHHIIEYPLDEQIICGIIYA